MSEFIINQPEVISEKTIRELFHDNLSPMITKIVEGLIGVHNHNIDREPFVLELH